jgi:hypothetical protein
MDKIPNTIRTDNLSLKQAWEQLARVINYQVEQLVNSFKSGVVTVFGRAGVVTAQKGDYTADQITGLAAVAKSGSYKDLKDTPTASALTQVNADWTSSTNPSRILNKPTVTGPSFGFILNSGDVGTNVGPELTPVTSWLPMSVIVVIKAVDPSIDLSFVINKNGVSAYTQTVVHGYAGANPISTVISTPFTATALTDKFTIDVISGTANWAVTIMVI